ncbi:WSSV081 [White spot syndrome virus]|uniref:WSSV081 n=1 Tax=White spot syndrome virus TaxID=342409 RepID=A0A2I6SBL4_9VIRU|nr:WSSV081 [White spot syndrome virus]
MKNIDENTEEGAETVQKNMVEQDAAVRIPLLVSYAPFSEMMRRAIDKLNEYYQLIDAIKTKIVSDTKQASSWAIKETDKELDMDKEQVISKINNLQQNFSNESDKIKMAISVLDNKRNELELQNNKTRSFIETTKSRIEAGGGDVANFKEIIDYENTSENDNNLFQSLKAFAADNSGQFTPH